MWVRQSGNVVSRHWSRPTIWAWRVRLWLAATTGRTRYWLVGEGRARVFTLALPLGLVIAGWPVWQAGLTYAGAAFILWALVGAQRRVVIEKFDDYTAPPGPRTGESKPEASDETPRDAGVAVLLANRLAEIRDLYAFVDDPGGLPSPGRTSGATVQLDDPPAQLYDASGALGAAVTTDASVKVGPITLPWGALVGAAAQFSQAPRLRGAIHGDGRALIITSELTHRGRSYSWRVVRDLEPVTSPRTLVASMVLDELAIRVFSDLTLGQQVSWPAIRYWLLALSRIAESQRRPGNRRLLLKMAGRDFADAMGEDERFYLAYLNLGVVYGRLAADTELQGGSRSARHYRQAARGPLERAISLRPERWEAYHALAAALWTSHASNGSTEMIPGLCERALDRQPDRAARARILDLSAHAVEKIAELDGGKRREYMLRSVLETRRRACAYALKELALARRRRARHAEARRLETLEKQASQSLINLALTTWRAGAIGDSHRGSGNKRAKATFKQVHSTARLAAKLSDLDAAAHATLAEMAMAGAHQATAVAELAAATRIAPGNPLYAAKLARSLASLEEPSAVDACKRAERLIDFGDLGDAEAARALADAYERLVSAEATTAPSGMLARAEAIRGRLDLPAALGAALDDEDPVAALARMLDTCPESRDWEKARLRGALGTAIVASGKGALNDDERRGRTADGYLKAALQWFSEHQHGHRVVAELHAARAEALSLIPTASGEAIAQAETAVALDPLRASYRDALATAYASGGDLDSAVTAADAAALLEPGVTLWHYRAARLRSTLAESVTEPGARSAQRCQATAALEHALMLCESDQTAERRVTSWWLARSHLAMGQFDRAPPPLRFVVGSLTERDEASDAEGLVRATADVFLAMTYRKLSDFYTAEEHARRAIKVATSLDARTGGALGLRFPAEMDDAAWPLGLVLVLAHVQLANSLAERGAALHEAWGSLTAAHDVLERMEHLEALAEAFRYARSAYETSRGRTLLAGGPTDEAIVALNRAADLDPREADVYLLLARAHAQAARRAIEDERQEHIRAARDACRRAGQLAADDDPTAHEAIDLDDALTRFEATGRFSA